MTGGSRRAVHYAASGPQTAAQVAGLEVLCGSQAQQMRFATATPGQVTCTRCLRYLRNEVVNDRRRHPQLSRRVPEGATDDGVSWWCTWKGRHWRVWPVPGRDSGWHLEEVTETGETAGHAQLTRTDKGVDAVWVGGCYVRVANLTHARALIAEMGDK